MPIRLSVGKSKFFEINSSFAPEKGAFLQEGDVLFFIELIEQTEQDCSISKSL
jgi:hypothetical protein